jgi:hypothetical protein
VSILTAFPSSDLIFIEGKGLLLAFTTKVKHAKSRDENFDLKDMT